MGIRINIRIKLIVSFLFVVLITGVSSLVIGYIVIIDNIYNQAKGTIRSHLNTTQYIYNDRINVIHIFINHLASLGYVRQAIVADNRRLLINKLKEVREELSLDILNIADAQGRIIARSSNPRAMGDSVIDDAYIQYVLKNHRSVCGSDIMSHKYLQMEGSDIAQKVYVKVKKTPHARPVEKNYEDRGLVLKAAAPIFYNDRVVGIIYGARLLNRNYEFVDRIQRLVFKDEKLDGKDVGNATVFLDDVRISTNVKTSDNYRALGTRVSEEVYNKVVLNKEVWDDRAFVVNTWYISAYAPIFNIHNDVIGILYVGLLEEKFAAVRKKANFYSLVMTLITGAIAIVLSLYLIQGIINPYNALINASKDIARGNYNTRVKILSNDEIAYLGKTFNKMVEAIGERDRKLKEQTQQQINQSEKLASLGRLASGIAHEINNPLTGILTYSCILKEDFEGTDFEEDIVVIVKETLRCREIVKGILDFARETKLEKEMTNINTIINDTMTILEKHINFHNIRIEKKLSKDIPDMFLDVNQMRSVINNLAVNAADAMTAGGEFCIETTVTQDKGGVLIKVADTGIGIPEENLVKIFDPFFTTKDTGKGTGLGMAVTYGIIQRHNGTINVQSEVGSGTTFTIFLPFDSTPKRQEGNQ